MKKLRFFSAAIACSYVLCMQAACTREFKHDSRPESLNLDERKKGEHGHHQSSPLSGQFSTNFSFIPDVANGWTPPNPAPAWYPGSGPGQLSHLGNCSTAFNQYATLGAAGLQTVGAPVNMFFSSALSAAGVQVPNTVTTIFYNSNGQSIWCQAQGASSTQPASPTRINFSVQLKIIGGTGRYSHAEGKARLNGYFNPQNSEDAGFAVDGRIEY